MTSYNGQAITYDTLGNPLNYLGKTLTWTSRELYTYTNGGTLTTYKYDSNGIRLSKTTGAAVTDYLYNGGSLIRQKSGTDTIWYLYDQNGIIGFQLNGTTYYYVRNLQGDVMRVINTSGTTVASYAYDAWGKCTIGTNTSGIADKNPIRYRGYYYDNETGFYYLNARYYDPETGRFISPDILVDNGSLYAYCGNDPVNRADPTGYAWWHWAIGAADVVGFAALTIVTAGGFAAGMAILGAAAGGTALAGATTLTTIAAFATVASGTFLAAYGIYAAIDSVETGVTQKSFEAGMKNFSDQGEAAMWGTIAAGAIGGFSGYMTHREQFPQQHNKIQKVGRIDGVQRSGTAIKGNLGVRYQAPGGKIYSVELHPNHNQHGVHLQKNQWLMNYPKNPGQYTLFRTLWRFKLW